MKQDLACYETRFGILVHHRADRVVGRSLRLYGEWAPGETTLLGRLLKPTDHVVDVGANIGFHSLFFSRCVGEQGCVTAVEPEPGNHQLLQLNSVLNGLRNQVIYNCLVGRDSRVVMSWHAEVDEENRGGTSFVLGDDGDSGPRCPLMQIALDDLEMERCNLLKVDVEGFEPAVFEGARDTLRRLRPWVFFEQKSQTGFEAIQELLAEADYRSFWYVSKAYPEFNMHGNEVDFFKGATETNILAVPRERVDDSHLLRFLTPVIPRSYTPPALSQLSSEYAARSRLLSEADLRWVRACNDFLNGPAPETDD